MSAANVRGRHMVDAIGFVEESYGTEAEGCVLSALPPEARSVFTGTLKEDGWYPLDAFVHYLATARRTLAPTEKDFFRRQGRYAGSRQRSFLGAMAATPETQRRMAPTIWRTYFDVGRLVIVGDSVETALSQIHDFPTTPELCERFLGTWESIASGNGRPMEAVKTRCTLKGDPYCELKLVAR